MDKTFFKNSSIWADLFVCPLRYPIYTHVCLPVALSHIYTHIRLFARCVIPYIHTYTFVYPLRYPIYTHICVIPYIHTYTFVYPLRYPTYTHIYVCLPVALSHIYTHIRLFTHCIIPYIHTYTFVSAFRLNQNRISIKRLDRNVFSWFKNNKRDVWPHPFLQDLSGLRKLL